MMIETLRAAVQAAAASKKAALITVVQSSGSTPAKPGFKMLLTEYGYLAGTVGGGALEQLALEVARRVIETGRSELVALREEDGGLAQIGMACQGGIELFVEYLSPGPKLYIYGAGHVGIALAEAAAFAGFSVILVDDRPELASPDRAPFARETHACDMVEFAANATGGPDTYVAIVTRGHAFDEQVLKQVLHQDPLPHYIGMMGSAHKVNTCVDHLRSEGFSEELIERVHAPIGLPIGGDTPREIAISIVAEMIACRYERDIGKVRELWRTEGRPKGGP